MSFSDGGTGFENPVIGGDGELVIDDIHSRAYVSGVSGWSIKRDGSAEFNNATVRGDFDTGTGGDSVHIVGSPIPSIDFDTSNPDEVSGARIGYTALGGNSFALQGPDFGQGADGIFFEANSNPSDQFLTIAGNDGLQIISKNTEAQIFVVDQFIGLFAPSGVGISLSDIEFFDSGNWIRQGSLETPSLQNSWVAFGAPYAQPRYCEMPDGTGMICGVIKDGNTAHGTVLFQLPSHVHPAEIHVFPATGNGGRKAQIAVQTDGDVVLQSPDSGLTWLSLGHCRWPINGF